MPRFEIDLQYLTTVLEDLLNTPSPTGDTEWAVGFCAQELEGLGAEMEQLFEQLLTEEPRLNVPGETAEAAPI